MLDRCVDNWVYNDDIIVYTGSELLKAKNNWLENAILWKITGEHTK